MNEFKRRFGIGDVVTVCMARNDCYPFQVSPRINDATILHYPCDTGDSWHLAIADGITFTINPQSSDFIGLAAVSNSEPDTGVTE